MTRRPVSLSLAGAALAVLAAESDCGARDCSPFGAARRAGWANYSADLQTGEAWVAPFTARIPSCWFYLDRERGWLLVVPWLAEIVDAWGRETMAIADLEGIVQAVKRHGPAAASMLLVKLAERFDRAGEV